MRLSNPRSLRSFTGMLRTCARHLLLIGLCGVGYVQADTLLLKDNASVSGKIVSEKPDLVAIDIGYTVLAVPRDRIAKVVREEQKQAPAKPRKAPKAAPAEAPAIPS